MKNLVMDIDNTITDDDPSDYANKKINYSVLKKIREYKKLGFNIILYTARNMKTFEGNIGRINSVTLPILIEWLDKNEVPYDEIHVGKPWCGDEGFYVDDKAVRPSEFSNLSYREIMEVLACEKK